MSESLVEALREEARALSSDQIGLRLPLHVLLVEATEVARFFERYFQAERVPGSRGMSRPGLQSVGDVRLCPDTSTRILALVDLVQAAQTTYQLAVEAPRGRQPIERGRFVLAELIAALEFLFDDGVGDEHDARLARVQRANENTASIDALASALGDHAALADQYRAELDGLGDFEAGMIDEAVVLAQKLRERSARGRSEAAQQAAEAIEQRNRLATLLSREVARVRRAARFVFRHHPQIRREATSAYERRTRAARRRAAARAEATTDTTTDTT